MKLKKIMSTLSLILVLNSMNVLAASGIPYKQIPKYMDPGTTITFDKSNNVVTLEKGEKTEFSKKNPVLINESTLPLAKEGMIVTYDALGQPIIINQDARKQSEVKVDVKKVEPNSQISNDVNIMATEHSQTGKTTYFYASGRIGESSVVLDEWSAAHMFLPWWTRGCVYDLESGTKSAVVYVLDRGNFAPGVILDIDVKRFTTNFYLTAKGWFDSKIVWHTN